MSGWVLHAVFALGGGLGAVGRHWLTRAVTHRFPVSTLVINVLGCLLLGAGTAALGIEAGDAPEAQRRLLIGFCGGFTTFSSFAYQSLDLHRSHTWLHAAGNIVTSLVLCLAAYWLGLQWL